MNRVLEIDEELGYAVVEPGVRWFDLYEAIQAGGHKLMALDRRPRLGQRRSATRSTTASPTCPTASTMAAQCGMEVVLANGELLRTGMGAMPTATARGTLYKRGLGPTLDQLFMQSNFGIVTKMGVWLMPQPECYMPLLAPGLERRRPRAGRRHAARADARPARSRCVPQISNTLCMASVLIEPRALVRRATARCPTT